MHASKSYSSLGLIVQRNGKVLFSEMIKCSALKDSKRLITTPFNKTPSFSYSGLVSKTFYQFSKTNSYVEHYHKIQAEIK